MQTIVVRRKSVPMKADRRMIPNGSEMGRGGGEGGGGGGGVGGEGGGEGRIRGTESGMRPEVRDEEGTMEWGITGISARRRLLIMKNPFHIMLCACDNV